MKTKFLFATGALIATTLSISCGVSSADRDRIDGALKTFVSQWDHGDYAEIYRGADDLFRKQQSLEIWSASSRSVRQQRGSLEGIEILAVERIAPMKEAFWIDAKMKYEKGNSRGRFVFDIREGVPHLVAANLEFLEADQTGK